MIATAPRLRATRTPFESVTHWFSAHPWVFAYPVLLLWVLIPEVRRLVDWRVGYNSISAISIIPLLVIIPFAAPLLYSRARHLNRAMATCAWLWFGGFTFAFVIGILNGDKLAATYTFAEFTLPALFGLWLATVDAPTAVLFDKISGFLLFVSTPIALYGVLQFVSPPEWDRAWMVHARITEIGLPLPFMLKPFSTLNAPGTFADFLVAVILLNLPRLGRIRPIQIAQLTLLVGALALTMVRSCWLSFALGVLAYIIMSPRRGRNLTIFVGVGILGTLLVFNASELLGSAQAGQDLSRRFSTLTDLSNDRSYLERQQYLGSVLAEALSQPLGQGLGVVGTAAKLSVGSTIDFDNGYVARLVEMGYFGTLCYLATIAAGLTFSFRYWRRARRAGLQHEAAIGAAAFALQLELAATDISSDHHNGLAGLFFWLSLAIVLGRNGLLAGTSHGLPTESRALEA